MKHLTIKLPRLNLIATKARPFWSHILDICQKSDILYVLFIDSDYKEKKEDNFLYREEIRHNAFLIMHTLLSMHCSTIRFVFFSTSDCLGIKWSLAQACRRRIWNAADKMVGYPESLPHNLNLSVFQAQKEAFFWQKNQVMSITQAFEAKLIDSFLGIQRETTKNPVTKEQRGLLKLLNIVPFEEYLSYTPEDKLSVINQSFLTLQEIAKGFAKQKTEQAKLLSLKPKHYPHILGNVFCFSEIFIDFFPKIILFFLKNGAKVILHYEDASAFFPKLMQFRETSKELFGWEFDKRWSHLLWAPKKIDGFLNFSYTRENTRVCITYKQENLYFQSVLCNENLLCLERTSTDSLFIHEVESILAHSELKILTPPIFKSEKHTSISKLLPQYFDWILKQLSIYFNSPISLIFKIVSQEYPGLLRHIDVLLKNKDEKLKEPSAFPPLITRYFKLYLGVVYLDLSKEITSPFDFSKYFSIFLFLKEKPSYMDDLIKELGLRRIFAFQEYFTINLPKLPS